MLDLSLKQVILYFHSSAARLILHLIFNTFVPDYKLTRSVKLSQKAEIRDILYLL